MSLRIPNSNPILLQQYDALIKKLLPELEQRIKSKVADEILEQSNSQSSELIRINDAAIKYKVGRDTIYYWIRAGLLKRFMWKNKAMILEDQISTVVEKVYNPKMKRR